MIDLCLLRNQPTLLQKCRKAPLNADTVASDFHGLVILAQSFYWPGVLKLSGTLLAQEGTTEQQRTEIIRLRFEALYRMKSYDELANEVTAILSEEERKVAVDVQPREFNHNIAVSMRLLLNDIKLMTGRSEEAVEQLNTMKAWLSSEAPTSNVLFWLWQVRCHIANGYIRLRNWRSASFELNDMLNDLQQRVLVCGSVEDRSQLVKGQIVLLTRLARLLFQVRLTYCQIPRCLSPMFFPSLLIGLKVVATVCALFVSSLNDFFILFFILILSSCHVTRSAR